MKKDKIYIDMKVFRQPNTNFIMVEYSVAVKHVEAEDMLLQPRASTRRT